jgi:Icc-related predicted phosphoesterase
VLHVNNRIRDKSVEKVLFFNSDMKIQIISDLHQEFGFMDIYFEGADLVILAGDINLGTKGIEWIKTTIRDVPVIYVLGNHEYYKGSYPKTLNAIRNSASDSNVHVLENKAVVIKDVTFHGATLWTDFALLGDSRFNGSICQGKMNDYKMIRRDPSYSKLRSIDTYVIHQVSLKWLRSSLELSTTKKNIVVTHHAPSPKSLPEEHKDDILSSAYASNLEPMILQYQPQFWIHGHIHVPIEYEVGCTKIICNPHGYMNEPYNGFEKNLIIEI